MVTNTSSQQVAIANKGFRGMRGAVARLKVRCNLIAESSALPYRPYRGPLSTALKQHRQKNTNDIKQMNFS